MDTVPESASSRPPMMRSRVDFPPPLGPSSAVSCPLDTCMSTFSSATKPPKRFVIPATSMLMRRPRCARRATRVLPCRTIRSQARSLVGLLVRRLTTDRDHRDGRDRDEDEDEGQLVRAGLELLAALVDHQRDGLGLADSADV